jgi:hypothetical protein
LRGQSKTFQDAQIELPGDLEALYSNHAIVRYSATGFAVDFVQVLPGRRVHRVRTRVLMAPCDALQFQQGLDEALCGPGDVDNKENGSTAARGHAAPRPDSGNHLAAGPKLPMLPPPNDQHSQQGGDHRPCPPEVVVPTDLAGITSSFVITSIGTTEVVLDFAHLLPNRFKITVVARIVMAPSAARSLAGTLEEALSHYCAKHGPVPVSNAEMLAPNLRNPARWGLSVPFALN